MKKSAVERRPELQKIFAGSEMEGDSEQLYSLVENELGHRILSVRSIFRLSFNGFCNDKFRRATNGIGKTLVVVWPNDGEKCGLIGGFTHQPWDHAGLISDSCGYYRDSSKSSFLFSLAKREVYPLRKENCDIALQSKEGFGPCFGDCLQVGEAPQESASSFLYEGKAYKVNLRRGRNPLHLKHTFRVIDYEVLELHLSD